MKRLAMPFMLACLSVFLSVPGCAGAYEKCVKPVASEVTWTGTATELGEVVGAFLACDPTFSGGEAPLCALQSLQALENSIGPAGTQVVNCMIAYFANSGTAAQKASAKAVAVKRGVNLSALRCPGTLMATQKESPAGGALRVPAGRAFSYEGENVSAAEKRCEETCGSTDAIGSPGGSCLCLRGRVWVAAR